MNQNTEIQQVHPLNQLRRDITNAVPTFGLSSEKEQQRMISVMMVAAEKNPEIVFADRASLIAAARQCANHGLVPDGNEAHLAIYNTKIKVNGKETWIQKVQYQPMVRGIINRILRSGRIISLWAECVYEGEEFSIDISQGDRRPIHNPNYFDRGKKMVGVYAVAKMKNGTVDCEPMSYAEIMKVKAVAKTKKVWDAWEDEKAKVACIRRLSKRLHMSAEDLDFIINREEHDMSTDPNAVISAVPQQNLAQRLAEPDTSTDPKTPETPPQEPENKPDSIPDAEIVPEYDDDAVDPFAGAYDEGMKAQQAGMDTKFNPYEIGTPDWNNWLGGHEFSTKGQQTSDAPQDGGE